MEARRCGQYAAQLAMAGHQDGSVAIVRQGSGSEGWLGKDNGQPYLSTYRRVELRDVAGKTRHMPPAFLQGTNNVSRAFIEYCLPLVGDLPGFERL
jgi:ATP-dependent phosphofructokinase / diphosphate-dependent phosphofructokinase